LDRFRAVVAEFGPGVHTYLTEADAVLSAYAADGSRKAQLIVSNPNWGSSPHVTLSVHMRLPRGGSADATLPPDDPFQAVILKPGVGSGLAEVEYDSLNIYSHHKMKDGAHESWEPFAARLSEGN